MTFKRGDLVEYTPAAVRALRPPDDEGKGTVEGGDSVAVLVRWPWGLADEFPKHLRNLSARKRRGTNA